MNRTEFINDLTESMDGHGLSKTVVKATVEAFEELVKDELAEGSGSVVLSGFVKFERKERAARTGRNPQTGAEIQIPAKTVVKVTPLKAFKDAVL
jgi:DNA-binding protein HU-beta